MISLQRTIHLIVAIICVGVTGQVTVGNDVTPASWNSLHRIGVEALSQEEPPFLEFQDPNVIEAQLRQASVIDRANRFPSRAPETSGIEDASTGTSVINDEKLQKVRGELRESLIQDGKASAEGRDDLTAEFFSVMRWTMVMLVAGGMAMVALKKLPQFQTPTLRGSGMKVIETLPLGRHQVLNLVQAAGERFLVASDSSGIKSVTMLPNWADGEVVAHDTSTPVVDSSAPASASIPLSFEKLITKFRSA